MSIRFKTSSRLGAVGDSLFLSKGKNLNPATIEMKSSITSNLLTFKTNGVPRFDVWVSPKLIDFKRKMEVKVNNTSWYKGMTKPDIGQLLEDVRIRADRQQIYWMKLTAG